MMLQPILLLNDNYNILNLNLYLYILLPYSILFSLITQFLNLHICLLPSFHIIYQKNISIYTYLIHKKIIFNLLKMPYREFLSFSFFLLLLLIDQELQMNLLFDLLINHILLIFHLFNLLSKIFQINLL